MKKLKVMGVHGLGDHRNSTWAAEWEEVLHASFPGHESVAIEFHAVTYDPIFEETEISSWEAAQAVWKLTRSAVGSAFRQKKGILGELPERIKWTAGYVVAWVEDAKFQKATRELILEKVSTIKPDIILAHSLGSLITYNAFSHRDAGRVGIREALRRARYVTLGSQLGNAFVVRNLTPGRIEPLPVRHWYHLYNDEDAVFTAPIRLWEANNFHQIDAHFDIDGVADHAATEYLAHTNTVEGVWRPIAEESINARAFGARKSSRIARTTRATRKVERPKRRALLVGINDYPNEADRLQGCLNDVFLMSSVLQECGFEAEDIRTCLDKRATAKGILSRLEWLLDDPKPGEERIFYYSGHGARIPQYGEMNEPDRETETLVPWDFDWSPETAIIDDQIWQLYSQLSYNTRLVMIFDCCHSGGIHRDGGPRARGLTPPDDIRHRGMKWDTKTQMWVERDFKRLDNGFSDKEDVQKAFFGKNGSTVRLGRAGLLRGLPMNEYDKRARPKRGMKEKIRVGPYLPLIIEACKEEELSYEYRHGATSYGAFTYSLSSILRRRRSITFGRLVEETRTQLAELGYSQEPQILGPTKIVEARVPWRGQG